MIHARHVLSVWYVAFVLAVALVVPVPAMPSGVMPNEDTSPISVSFATPVSFAASEQGGEDLSGHALVCHMHFEHHQLVRSDNAVVIPPRHKPSLLFNGRQLVRVSRASPPSQTTPRLIGRHHEGGDFRWSD